MKNLVKLTALILFCSNSFVHTHPSEYYTSKLYPEENGKFVHIPATTGGIIGMISGFFIGIPIGLVGSLVAPAVSKEDPRIGFYIGMVVNHGDFANSWSGNWSSILAAKNSFL